MLTVGAFVTTLHLHDFRTILTAPGIEDAVAVEAILVVIRLHDHVAVLGVAHLIHELAVLIVDDIEREEWHVPHECSELREERLREIEITTVALRIPLVAVPSLVMISFEWTIRCDDGEDLLAEEIAFPKVQVSLHAPGQTTLKTALRTEGRGRQRNLLIGNGRGNFGCQSGILLGEIERCLALTTVLLHTVELYTVTLLSEP